MDKGQALHNFWNQFLPAYDSSSVPDDAEMPYITYGISFDSLDTPVSMSASLWYKSTSWADISQKAEYIGKHIAEFGFTTMRIDNGYIYITQGHPFAQRLEDEDDRIKRIILNIDVEFLTAY